MANIFLTPTAEFKPFSYAEMLAPVAAYQEAYDDNNHIAFYEL